MNRKLEGKIALIIYPDSNRGAHHMYPELFVEHATLFLNPVTTTA